MDHKKPFFCPCEKDWGPHQSIKTYMPKKKGSARGTTIIIRGYYFFFNLAESVVLKCMLNGNLTNYWMCGIIDKVNIQS